MKNHECNIVRDILPLYVENVVSDDTRQFVDGHLSKCVNCQRELALLKIDIPFEKNHQETDAPAAAMKKIGLYIKKKRVLTGIVSAAIAAAVVILLFSFLTAPAYIPYTEPFDIVTVHENNGSVTLTYTGELELHQSKQGIYDISVYNTVWSRLFNTTKNQTQTITVNPNGEQVDIIYYVSNGGPEDKIIYGANPNPNEGRVTLPRLFLNAYFVIAIFASAVLVLSLLLFRKKQKIKTIIVKTLFVPVSYIVSHIMITGFNAASYAATRDFYLILLLAMPIYFLLFILYKKINAK